MSPAWWGALVAELAAAVALLGRPACCALLIDGMLAGGCRRSGLAALALLMLWLLRLAAVDGRDRLLAVAEQRCARRLRATVLALGPGSGTPARLSEVEAHAAFAVRLPLEACSMAVRCSVATGLLLGMHPALAMAVLPAAVGIPVVVEVGRRLGAPAAAAAVRARGALRLRWREARAAPHLGAWLGPDVVRLHAQVADAEVTLSAASAAWQPVAQGLLILGLALALVPGAAAVTEGTLTPGDLTAGAFLIVLALGPVIDALAGGDRWLQWRVLRARLPASVGVGAGCVAAVPPRRTLGAGVAVRTRGLRVPWGALPDLDLAPGSRHLLRGPSGSGKSTLLRVLAGEQDATGWCDIGGLATGRMGVVLIPQEARIAAVAPEQLGMSGGEIAEAAKRLGLQAPPVPWTALTATQRQMLLLILAAVARPRLLLLDEATTALAPADAVRALQALAADGSTVLVATHADSGIPPWPELRMNTCMRSGSLGSG